MKYAIALNAVLVVFASLLTACGPDSSDKTGVFVIEIDKTYAYPAAMNMQPEEFKGSVPAIEGKIDHRYNLGVIGSITNGKLRLTLPAHIEDDYLQSITGGTDTEYGLKYGKLDFISGAFLVLSRDSSLNAELSYYNQDAPPGIKQGWNFKYREPGGPYKYTNDIKALYAPGEGYLWLVRVIPSAGESKPE
ncbi:MAG: hypothetical protein LBF77_09735 [Spirochaetaceae bacterium]|jgi:hypothetical protein|nr:hypothetical protein [Spirochaetaceae bacterium]